MLATAIAAGLIGSAQAGDALFFNGGPQLLGNPGFESGAFAPWISGGGLQSVSNSTPHSGTFAASMGCVGAGCVVVGPTGVSGPGSVTQTLTLQPGIYQYSFWLTNPPGNNQFAASVGNNVLINQSMGVIPYTQFSFITAVSGGTTNVAFAVQQDPSFMHEDDNALIQVDDGNGNNIGAASQTVASQGSREFMEPLFDSYGTARSPMAWYNTVGNYRFFFNGFGDNARWNAGDANASRLGFMVGADFQPWSTVDLGLAFGYANSHYRTETLFTNNRGRAQETFVALYGNYRPDCLPGWYVSGVTGYGRSTNRLMRENFLGAVGASVPVTQWFSGLETGFDLQGMQGGFALTPFVRIDGADLSQKTYWEKVYDSGQLVPAWVLGRNQWVGRTLAGLRATTDFQGWGSNDPWQLSFKLAYQYEFNRKHDVEFFETTAPVTFSGRAIGATPVASSAVVGLGLSIPYADRLNITVSYNGNFGSGQDIHTGWVGIKSTW
jgi:outer membrane autotransporter protein